MYSASRQKHSLFYNPIYMGILMLYDRQINKRISSPVLSQSLETLSFHSVHNTLSARCLKNLSPPSSHFSLSKLVAHQSSFSATFPASLMDRSWSVYNTTS
ncbi:hypothetical protein CIPAW_07G039600 [Carya illinoinensis]|uniref:Uncharacterized protein n=1 Tax=Carya illinoinensis TaxID=32201 RepID=A0A8T1PRT7_CARIL|nr:hypothetical protein CIPAW_07G039600 [Carya illinoinensis]